MRNLICRFLCRDTRTANQAATDGHIGITDAELSAKSKGELALWQSNHQNEPSKVILAEQEWQNRRLSRQIRTTYFVAFIGLAGVALGWYLRSLEIPPLPINKIQGKAEGHEERKQPNAVQNNTGTGKVPSHIPQPRPREDSAKTEKQQPNGTTKP